MMKMDGSIGRILLCGICSKSFSPLIVHPDGPFGYAELLTEHRVICLATGKGWCFYCPFCPLLATPGSSQASQGFKTSSRSKLEEHVVRKHLEHLQKESHLGLCEPRAEYPLRSWQQGAAQPDDSAPKPIGVSLIPLQGCENIVYLDTQIAAEKQRREAERQRQDSRRAEDER